MTEYITGRAMWVNLITPNTFGDSSRFRITVYLDKEKDADEIKHVQELVQAAYDAASTPSGAWKGSKPKAGYWLNPLKDGDAAREEQEGRGDTPEAEYAGRFIVSASQKRFNPVAVDANLKPLTADSQVEWGAKVKLAVEPWAYKGRDAGVTFSLLGVQVVDPKGEQRRPKESIKAEVLFGNAKDAAETNLNAADLF